MAATTAKTLQLVILWIAFGACWGFDCRWKGANCNNGTCNTQTGECIGCNETMPPTEGYDCGLVTDLINTTFLCDNGGTGYGDDLCYCPENVFGPTCSSQRYDGLTDSDKMTVFLRPLDGMSGSVYVQGEAGNPQCQIPASDDNYTLALPHDTCGTPLMNDTFVTRKIIVQFDNNYLSGIDLLVTFTGNKSGRVAEFDVVSLSAAGVDLQPNQHSVTGTFNPITWTRTTLDDQAVPDQPIGIGTVIVYTFSVPSVGYAGLKLESAVANNTLTGNDSETTQLIEDGCIQEIAINADGAPNGYTQPSKTTVIFKLRVFQYTGSDTIALKFVFKVCIVESDCALSSCSGEVSRKRRSLDQDEVEVYTYLRVRGPGDQDTEPTVRPSEDVTKPDAVYDTYQLFIIVITIETAVLTLFVVALIAFGVHWYRTKNRDTKHFQN